MDISGPLPGGSAAVLNADQPPEDERQAQRESAAAVQQAQHVTTPADTHGVGSQAGAAVAAAPGQVGGEGASQEEEEEESERENGERGKETGGLPAAKRQRTGEGVPPADAQGTGAEPEAQAGAAGGAKGLAASGASRGGRRAAAKKAPTPAKAGKSPASQKKKGQLPGQQDIGKFFRRG